LDPEGPWTGRCQRGPGGDSAQRPAGAAPKGSPVVHFEVIGKNCATLDAFYGGLFGWKLDANNPVGYGVIARDDNLTADGIGIGGGMMALPPEMAQDSSGHVTWYVEVPDVEAALVKAARSEER